MEKWTYNGTNFNIKDTLECGQVFRYSYENDGYYLFSADKAIFCTEKNGITQFYCEKDYVPYFKNYFDLERDYYSIYSSATKEGGILKISANLGKGIRILNQNKEEVLFSFIISQNNNIPRIKLIIERLCFELGEKKSFNNKEYYTFPTAEALSSKNIEFYKKLGLGYRAEYVKNLADKIANGFNLENLSNLPTENLKSELIKLYGVGPKVADCVSLFGFHKSDSFPVDTWIEKVYRQNFNGLLKDRKKITKFFTDKFKENSGYYQQYLFYYKRSLENYNKKQ